jgi:carbon storage regulator
MLAITRRPGETIVIELPSGERVSVAVVRIRGNQVRLSVEAPREVPVARGELLITDGPSRQQ